VDGLDSIGSSGLDRGETDRVSLDQDVSSVGRVEAAQDLDQRALAGAVVPDQPEHFALVQSEVDAAQDRERAEALGHAAHLEDGRPGGNGWFFDWQGVGAHLDLERAMTRSNWTLSAIATMITT